MPLTDNHPYNGSSLATAPELGVATRAEMAENRQLRARLLAEGHAPQTTKAKVIADDHPQASVIGERTVDDADVLEIDDAVLAACVPTCPACHRKAKEIESEHEDLIGSEIGYDDPFTKSSLGGDPMHGTPSARNGAWGTGAGVRMGVGVGGRVPNGVSAMFDMDELDAIKVHPDGFDMHELDDEIGCGIHPRENDPRHIPRDRRVSIPTKHGIAVSSQEEISRIVAGDFSVIPPHDYEICEWNTCTDKACKNYKRWSIGGRLLNKLLDVAESLRFAVPVLAGAAATRKIAQAGIPPLELLTEIHRDQQERKHRSLDDVPNIVGNKFVNLSPMPLWDAPGADDLLPVEDHLDKYYVGIFR